MNALCLRIEILLASACRETNPITLSETAKAVTVEPPWRTISRHNLLGLSSQTNVICYIYI